MYFIELGRYKYLMYHNHSHEFRKIDRKLIIEKLAEDIKECLVKELDYQFRVASEEEEQHRKAYMKQQEEYFQTGKSFPIGILKRPIMQWLMVSVMLLYFR